MATPAGSSLQGCARLPCHCLHAMEPVLLLAILAIGLQVLLCTQFPWDTLFGNFNIASNGNTVNNNKMPFVMHFLRLLPWLPHLPISSFFFWCSGKAPEGPGEKESEAKLRLSLLYPFYVWHWIGPGYLNLLLSRRHTQADRRLHTK